MKEVVTVDFSDFTNQIRSADAAGEMKEKPGSRTIRLPGETTLVMMVTCHVDRQARSQPWERGGGGVTYSHPLYSLHFLYSSY